MATSPMQNPQQQQGASPQGGAPSVASQAPASPEQIMLSHLAMAARQLADNPIIGASMQKVIQAIQEAQTALVTQPQQTPQSQQPLY